MVRANMMIIGIDKSLGLGAIRNMSLHEITNFRTEVGIPGSPLTEEERFSVWRNIEHRVCYIDGCDV
jgi:hypothetical protein